MTTAKRETEDKLVEKLLCTSEYRESGSKAFRVWINRAVLQQELEKEFKRGLLRAAEIAEYPNGKNRPGWEINMILVTDVIGHISHDIAEAIKKEVGK